MWALSVYSILGGPIYIYIHILYIVGVTHQARKDLFRGTYYPPSQVVSYKGGCFTLANIHIKAVLPTDLKNRIHVVTSKNHLELSDFKLKYD